MTLGKPLSLSIPAVVQRYGLALVSVAVALGIDRVLFSHEVKGVGFLIFLIAIALTAWYAGVGPSILALVLSTLAFDYYFTEPYHSFYITRRFSLLFGIHPLCLNGDMVQRRPATC